LLGVGVGADDLESEPESPPDVDAVDALDLSAEVLESDVSLLEDEDSEGLADLLPDGLWGLRLSFL
jgi:hypothetical protein